MILTAARPSRKLTKTLEGLRSRWNHRFLVGVLYCVADLQEQLQTLPGRQSVTITVLRDVGTPATYSLTK
jgi:hypothetical protein